MKNNTSSFIILAGIFIVVIFTFISIYNIMPSNKESKTYYAKIDNGIDGKIENIEISGNTLIITTSGNIKKYCVKTTRSNPSSDFVCFKNIDNNIAKVNIYKYKKYYIWVKDENGVLSDVTSVSS